MTAASDLVAQGFWLGAQYPVRECQRVRTDEFIGRSTFLCVKCLATDVDANTSALEASLLFGVNLRLNGMRALLFHMFHMLLISKSDGMDML